MGTILHLSDQEPEQEEIQEQEKEAPSGSCFVIGTPIAERDDMTQRAVRTLQSADFVVTSDERFAASLLKRFALSKRLLGIGEEIEEDVTAAVMEALETGKRLVILSDPSFRFSPSLLRLINTIREAGLEPRVIPGVDLIATALAMSGFDAQQYSVVGVAPARREERMNFISSLVARPETIVVPGGNSRIVPTLAALAQAMPEREAALILRPTIPGEKIMRGHLGTIVESFGAKRFNGQYVVVLGPETQAPEEEVIYHETASEA